MYLAKVDKYGRGPVMHMWLKGQEVAAFVAAFVSGILHSLDLCFVIKLCTLLIIITLGLVVCQSLCKASTNAIDELGSGIASSCNTLGWILLVVSLFSNSGLRPHSNNHLNSQVQDSPNSVHSLLEARPDALIFPMPRALGPPRRLLTLGPIGAAFYFLWSYTRL